MPRASDATADFALDLRGGEGKALVGAPGRHTKGRRPHVAQIVQNRLRDHIDVKAHAPRA